MKKVLFLFILSYLPFLSFAQNALKSAWVLDPIHSSIQFSVPHMGLAEVVGQFKAYEAEYLVEKDKFEEADFRIQIEVNSIETWNEQRNAHLLSPDFFDAKQYPTLIFSAQELVRNKKAGKNWYKLVGELTCRGISKVVELDVRLGNKPVTGLQGETRFGFTAKATLSRKAFGIKFNPMMDNDEPLIGDEVFITINLEFIQSVKH